MTARNQTYLHFLFCAVGIVSLLVIWSGTVRHLAEIVWTVDSYSHGWMVPLISAGLIWSRRDNLNLAALKYSPAGVFLVIAASVLWLLAAAAEVRLGEHIALVLGIQGIVVVTLGWRFYRSILFPMLFLFLTIPIGENLIPVMQTYTAEIVIFLLSMFGVPVSAEGVLITIPSGVFEVARACAGVKFFFTSVVLGVLLAHLVYRSWARRIIIVIVSALLPIIANAIRVLGILLVAEQTDASFAKGIDHIVYGWGFLSFILIVLILVAYQFSDAVDEETKDRTEQSKADNFKGNFSGATIFVLILTVFFPGLAFALAPTETPVGASFTAAQEPLCENCDIRAIDYQNIGQGPQWHGADNQFTYKYRSGGDTILMSAALYCPQRGERRLIQTGNMPGGSGWDLLPGIGSKVIEQSGWKLKREVYWKNNQRRVVYVGYFLNGKALVSETWVKIESAVERLVYGASAGAVFALSMPETSGFARSPDKLEKFLSTFPLDRVLWSELQGSDRGHNLCVE